MADVTDRDQRMVKVFSGWERKSARGTKYITAYRGGCQVVGFFKGEKPHPKRPDESVLLWEFFIQEADASRRPGSGR